MAYKRNQLVEAIETTLASGRTDNVATKLRRLLHADRLLGRNARSNSPEHRSYAFFSGELAGSGNENLYSPFEAFALLVGIRLLDSGYPQGVVVRILRVIRAHLEGALEASWKLSQRDSGVRYYLVRLTPEVVSSSAGTEYVKICLGEAAVANFLKKSAAGQIMTVIELTDLTNRFRKALEASVPLKRGR
jgi:hypothetical protein